MIIISNLVLEVLDGSTTASTEIYGADKKTYINIGSGNVFKLAWETPILANDTLDYYNLVIKRHDTALNVYYDIFNKTVGLVNEFYVDASLLPAVPDQYMLSIYLVGHGKYGNVITSNIVNPYVSNGGGSYIKVEAGLPQPIMKRAVAFIKTQLPALTEANGLVLLDAEGNVITLIDLTNEYTLKDRNGEPLFDNAGMPVVAVATKVLPAVNDWVIVQDVYTKDDNGQWQLSDIEYEVLVDDNNTIIVDENNEPIYVQ